MVFYQTVGEWGGGAQDEKLEYCEEKRPTKEGNQGDLRYWTKRPGRPKMLWRMDISGRLNQL